MNDVSQPGPDFRSRPARPHPLQPDQGQPPTGQLPPQPPTNQAPPKKKGGKGKWILLGVVGVVAIIGIANAVSGDDTDTTASDEAAKGDATDTKPDTGPAKEQGAQDAELPGIGGAVEDGSFSFTVTGVDDGGTQIGNSTFGDQAQGKFVLVKVTVTNRGDQAGDFFGENQYLYDANNREFSADTEAAMYLEESQSLWEEINPGNTVKGTVVFDIPEGAEPAKVKLHESLLSGGVEVGLE